MTKLKSLQLILICAASLASGMVFADGPITININAAHSGAAIPTNFVGLSVSSWSIDGDDRYARCFTAANLQMINLFREIGITHLRTIMNKADEKHPEPTFAQVDAFFDFARAAGVSKVIWSLHLMNASGVAARWSNNKAIAAHIWKTTTARGTVEKDLLESFAFDNEPDWLRYICCADPVITGYHTPAGHGYVDAWSEWQRVIAGIAPGAEFSGPDTGSKWPAGQGAGEVKTAIDGVPFTLRFATDEAAVISLATQHFYGQHAGSNTVLQMATACLSPGWAVTNYALLYSNALAGATSPVWPKNSDGAPLPYRLTECSAFDNSRNPGNQCFATALWTLDFYHWWAAHGCAGTDPFTRTAQYNSPIYYDGANYIAEPSAYGMKAFNLGSAGKTISLADFVVSNPVGIDVTAYGVVNANHLYVTVINKTFDETGSATAEVKIPTPAGFAVRNAKYIVLSGGLRPGSSGDAIMRGACLGGATIPNDGSPWRGAWRNLKVSKGGVSLAVMPTTAVVIDLQN
jgi:hypothetical protein